MIVIIKNLKFNLINHQLIKVFLSSFFKNIIKPIFAAYLTYVLNGDVIDFQHTFVPSKYRGQGIAEKLVLVKSCSFFLSNDNLILLFRML